MNIGEKAAYLKGLAEGLDISPDSKNGKIIKGILDILEDIADSIGVLEEENKNLNDYVAEIDEDLGALEEDYEKNCGCKLIGQPRVKEKWLDNYWSEDDEYEDDDDGEDDEYDEDEYDDDEYDEDDEKESEENELLDGVLELKCPHCKKRVFVKTDEILESDDMAVECPQCGEEIEVEVESGGCSCPHCAVNQKDGDDDVPF